MTQVWSCGGGTQSGAIAALIRAGKLPRPDYIVVLLITIPGEVDVAKEKRLPGERRVPLASHRRSVHT